CRARRRCSRMSTRRCRRTCGGSARSWGSRMARTNDDVVRTARDEPGKTATRKGNDGDAGRGTTRMTMIQALRSAMDVMLERDPDVVVFGQDVGYFGGVFRCTEGLQAKYGKSRVFDAPISEGGIVGAAVGMSAYGLRPVVEIQFAD